MRIIFMGTPRFAATVLGGLLGGGVEVLACYCRAPRPAGRGMEMRKSPVHEMAERFSIPVFAPSSLRGEESRRAFASHGADAAFVAAYGLILPESILSAPPLGCWNAHASLLPRWRGPDPIRRAIMSGDAQVGVSIMRMEEGVDVGAVGMAEAFARDPNMTAGELHEVLANRAADMAPRALAAVGRGALELVEQDEAKATYAAKIEPHESRIDWTLPAEAVRDRIHGLSPRPGAWREAILSGRSERLRFLRCAVIEPTGRFGEPGGILGIDAQGIAVACGSGKIRLLELQRPGRRAQSAPEFMRGVDLDSFADN